MSYHLKTTLKTSSLVIPASVLPSSHLLLSIHMESIRFLSKWKDFLLGIQSAGTYLAFCWSSRNSENVTWSAKKKMHLKRETDWYKVHVSVIEMSCVPASSCIISVMRAGKSTMSNGKTGSSLNVNTCSHPCVSARRIEYSLAEIPQIATQVVLIAKFVLKVFFSFF